MRRCCPSPHKVPFSGGVAHILDYHDEKRELDPERFVRVAGAGDERRRYVGRHDLQHRALDVAVCDALDVPITHLLLPDLQRFGTDRIEDGEEPRLECVLEHACWFFGPKERPSAMAWNSPCAHRNYEVYCYLGTIGEYVHKNGQPF